MSKKILLNFFLCMIVVTSQVIALPQFTLLSGNRCNNCHTNMQGGGLRNELGAYSYSDVGLVKPKWIGMKGVYDVLAESNQIGDGLITYGFDGRVQSYRGFTSENSKRNLLFMQATPYVAVHPTNWLTVEGLYNLAEAEIPGQAQWMSSVIIAPTLDSAILPTLRIGRFQPSIGLRYDDHTMWTRQIPIMGRGYIIAPDYAEFGAELGYEGLKWLTLNAGVFGSSQLSQVKIAQESLVQTTNAPTYSARAVVWPRFFDKMVNTYVGASVLGNGDFSMTSGFAGVGLTDYFSISYDYSGTKKTDVFTSNTSCFGLMYQLDPALLLTARYETGTTKFTGTVPSEFSAQQASIGAMIFVLPFLEIRPEYRFWGTDQANLPPGMSYQATRWFVQAHVFY